MFEEYIDRFPVEDGEQEFVIRSGTLPAPQQSLTANQLVIKKGLHEYGSFRILDAISEPTSTLEYLLKYFGKLPLFKETITKVFFVIYLPNAFIEYRKTIGRNGRANRADEDSS